MSQEVRHVVDNIVEVDSRDFTQNYEYTIRTITTKSNRKNVAMKVSLWGGGNQQGLAQMPHSPRIFLNFMSLQIYY